MKMKKEVINSSCIEAFEYDTITEKLSVIFKGGRKAYDFEGVPEEVIAKWFEAPSAGKFYNENIRGRYAV